MRYLIYVISAAIMPYLFWAGGIDLLARGKDLVFCSIFTMLCLAFGHCVYKIYELEST